MNNLNVCAKSSRISKLKDIPSYRLVVNDSRRVHEESNGYEADAFVTWGGR